MTFITLVMLSVLCLFIPVAMPFAALGAVTLLYFYTYQTVTLLGVFLLGWIFFLILKRKFRNAHY